MSCNVNQPKLFFDKDADLKWIKDYRIGIIGYGNQGKAQALNLRDSGIDVTVGLRENSSSGNLVEKEGLNWKTIDETVEKCDIVSLLVPDQIMPDIFEQSIMAFLSEKKTLLFSHGYNIHYQKIVPPNFVDVIMVAPSGAGKIVRKSYVEGSGVPNLIAIHQDASGKAEKRALAYSKAIGGTRLGSFMSTFEEETETDLFGEQVVLCGGIPKLIETAFDVLVEKGYQPIVAWYVCFYEVKLIVDLFHVKGFAYMGEAISDTAEYGGFTIGDKIVNDNVKNDMRKVVEYIKSNQFKNEWTTETKNKFSQLNSYRGIRENSLFQKTTKKILELQKKKS